jgi:hypothetical protein
MSAMIIAQSFSPFLARDGRQVHRPSWIWATSLCYILLNKFVALVGSGQQTCRPSRDKKGLKDWANVSIPTYIVLIVKSDFGNFCTFVGSFMPCNVYLNFLLADREDASAEPPVSHVSRIRNGHWALPHGNSIHVKCIVQTLSMTRAKSSFRPKENCSPY